MLSLVQIAKRRGKQVILETPNPIAPNVGDLTPYVQTMKDIATLEQVRIIDQFQYLTTELRGRRVETFMPDGVHPSDEVYVLKGRFAAARYAELFP